MFRRALLAILLIVVLALRPDIGKAERIDSGSQTIQGTRVFTQIYHERGYATFTNDCGTQRLTQGQLQNGAIPNDIIPCPRPGGGGGGAGRVQCGGGESCPSGYLCIGGGKCMPRTSPRHCGNGRFCSEGEFCVQSENKCYATTAQRYCGNGRYCGADEACNNTMPEGSSRCFKLTSPRYCGGGRFCGEGQFCVAAENKCYATDAPRYCGNGRFCSADEACNNTMPEGSNRCFKLTSPHYCGEGRFCGEDQFCVPAENKCYATTAPRYCGNGRFCGADQACNTSMPEGSSRCFALTSPRYCGGGRFCGPGTVCKDASTCVEETETKRPTGDAALSAADCTCISVLPTGTGAYTVTNSCGPLGVSVKFGGDILPMSPSTSAMTSWADAGEVTTAYPRRVSPPSGWTMVSIAGITVRRKTSSYTCTY